MADWTAFRRIAIAPNLTNLLEQLNDEIMCLSSKLDRGRVHGNSCSARDFFVAESGGINTRG